MAISPNSQIVQPTEYIQPIPFEVLAMGYKANEERLQKRDENFNNRINTLFKIPSLPGKDTEVKNKILSEAMQKIQEFAKNPLDKKAENQLNNYITSISNNPSLLNIATRASQVGKWQEEEKQLSLKGQKYFNKGLFEAQRYIQSGVYSDNQRFSDIGGVAPDEAKILEQVKKIATAKAELSQKNGLNITTKEILEKDGRAIYNQIANSDPNYRTYYKVMWEEQNLDKTPEQLFDNYITPLVYEAESYRNNLVQKYSFAKNDVDRAKIVQEISNIDSQLSQYSQLRGNPNAANQIKEFAINQSINESANAAISAISGVENIQIQTNQFALENAKLKNDLVKEQSKVLATGASLMNKTLAEVMSNPKLMNEAVKLGLSAEKQLKPNLSFEDKLDQHWLKTQALKEFDLVQEDLKSAIFFASAKPKTDKDKQKATIGQNYIWNNLNEIIEELNIIRKQEGLFEIDISKIDLEDSRKITFDGSILKIDNKGAFTGDTEIEAEQLKKALVNFSNRKKEEIKNKYKSLATGSLDGNLQFDEPQISFEFNPQDSTTKFNFIKNE